jgi:hypothetical protein
LICRACLPLLGRASASFGSWPNGWAISTENSSLQSSERPAVQRPSGVGTPLTPVRRTRTWRSLVLEFLAQGKRGAQCSHWFVILGAILQNLRNRQLLIEETGSLNLAVAGKIRCLCSATLPSRTLAGIVAMDDSKWLSRGAHGIGTCAGRHS